MEARNPNLVGRVLVVEDDAVIRQSLERVLTKLCPTCDVQVVESGALAIEALAKSPADMVISDHSMPGMTGLELFAQIKTLHPEANRYLVTAYPLSELVQEDVEQAELHGFLAKPFQIADIKKLIDDVLG